MSDEPYARVEVINGQLVLIDPVAEGMLAALDAHARRQDLQRCQQFYEINKDRIKHFANRCDVLGRHGGDTVIVILEVDTRFGKPLAEQLMPGHNWQVYRDRGELPIARGLAEREGIQRLIELVDPQAHADLKAMTQLAVVVLAGDAFRIFPAVP